MVERDTPGYVENEYVRVMGNDLGRLFYELVLEKDWLSDKWAVFDALFEQGPERIALLNRTASNFFGTLNKLLYEDAMLHLSRLTDPPDSGGGKTNLTVTRLPSLIGDPKFKASVEADVERFVKACSFARDVPNRLLAHKDLRTSRSEHPLAIPDVKGQDIVRAMQCLQALLASIENIIAVKQSRLCT